MGTGTGRAAGQKVNSKGQTKHVDTSLLPKPKPDPKMTLPAVQRRKLSNGLEVLVVEHHELPVVSMNLVTKMGASGDPALTNPTIGIAGCCARAASGHATATPPSVNMNSRRRMWIAMRPSRRRSCACNRGTISRFSEGTNNAFALRKS